MQRIPAYMHVELTLLSRCGALQRPSLRVQITQRRPSIVQWLRVSARLTPLDQILGSAHRWESALVGIAWLLDYVGSTIPQEPISSCQPEALLWAHLVLILFGALTVALLLYWFVGALFRRSSKVLFLTVFLAAVTMTSILGTLLSSLDVPKTASQLIEALTRNSGAVTSDWNLLFNHTW